MMIFSKVLKAAVLAAGLAAGTANAAVIGYLSNLVGPTDTEVSYTLTMPKFNPALGTLTGVTIYFYATESVSTLTLENTSAVTTQSFGAAATVNFVSGMVNSATSIDKYNPLLQTLTYFDTGISANIGSCTENGPGDILPNQCSQLNFNPLQSEEYAPFTFANTDDLFMNDPNNTLVKGTGTEGLTGVIRIGTSISNYVGGGTWSLSGTTVNLLTTQGAGGNISFDQETTGTFQAEVDYTYTAAAVPEPATMGLMGSVLAAAVLLRKRLKK
jgi:hypothetical protein